MIQEEKTALTEKNEMTEKTEKAAGEKVKELQKELTWSFPNIAKEAPSQKEEAFEYCEAYKAFLDCAKTEREFTRAAVKLLNEAGYTPFEKGKDYKSGDKVYYVNRNKSLIMTTFGRREIGAGVRLNVAHIDSPRLDLKPNPMYEKAEMAFSRPIIMEESENTSGLRYRLPSTAWW